MIDEEWLENWKQLILKECGEDAVNMIFDKNNKLTYVGSFILCMFLIQGTSSILSCISNYNQKRRVK